MPRIRFNVKSVVVFFFSFVLIRSFVPHLFAVVIKTHTYYSLLVFETNVSVFIVLLVPNCQTHLPAAKSTLYTAL